MGTGSLKPGGSFVLPASMHEREDGNCDMFACPKEHLSVLRDASAKCSLTQSVGSRVERAKIETNASSAPGESATKRVAPFQDQSALVAWPRSLINQELAGEERRERARRKGETEEERARVWLLPTVSQPPESISFACSPVSLRAVVSLASG